MKRENEVRAILNAAGMDIDGWMDGDIFLCLKDIDNSWVSTPEFYEEDMRSWDGTDIKVFEMTEEQFKAYEAVQDELEFRSIEGHWWGDPEYDDEEPNEVAGGLTEGHPCPNEGHPIPNEGAEGHGGGRPNEGHPSVKAGLFLFGEHTKAEYIALTSDGRVIPFDAEGDDPTDPYGLAALVAEQTGSNVVKVERRRVYWWLPLDSYSQPDGSIDPVSLFPSDFAALTGCRDYRARYPYYWIFESYADASRRAND